MESFRVELTHARNPGYVLLDWSQYESRAQAKRNHMVRTIGKWSGDKVM